MIDKFAAQKIQKAWTTARNKPRTCQFKGCQQKAIKSHVFQKNGILNQVAIENHLFHLAEPNPFHAIQGKVQRPKRVGINDVYTFLGYCNEHDTKIFAPIETETNVDLFDPKVQVLFCYRAVCQEIFRKQVAIEVYRSTISFFPKELRSTILNLSDGTSRGIESLSYFKEQLENALTQNDYSNHTFVTIEIPRIGVCISVPLNIDKPQPDPDSYEEYLANRPAVIPTSYVNIFPWGNKSYVIAGYNKEYPNEWTEGFISKMRSGSTSNIFKAISDLITLRVEFWAMSPKLFESISPEKFQQYDYLFRENILSHDDNLATDLNLFDHLVGPQ